MIREGIQKLIEGTDLTYEESGAIMTEVMSGKATNCQTAAFLTALRMKGEAVEEINSVCVCYEESLPTKSTLKSRVDSSILSVQAETKSKLSTSAPQPHL